MELKDVILSTLQELENASSAPIVTQDKAFEIKEKIDFTRSKVEQKSTSSQYSISENEHNIEDETKFLDNVRERLLVLFEGFQSPNNVKIEAKVDLTLNFLEYLLATIDSRIEKITPKER
jgi:hypothetical protein